MCDDEPMSIKPMCLTYQEKPCLLNFDCSLDSPTISNKIIEYFTDNDFDYIMPDCGKHEYLFSKVPTIINCHLYKNSDLINVCLTAVSATNTNESIINIFNNLRNLFIVKKKPIVENTNMTALEMILAYY